MTDAMAGPVPMAVGTGPKYRKSKLHDLTPALRRRQGGAAAFKIKSATLKSSRIPTKPVERFARFAQLEEGYDEALRHCRELANAAAERHPTVTEHWVDFLVAALSCDSEAELRRLWPGEDIHSPSRWHITRRLAELLASFPAAAPPTYLQRLVVHVGAEAPSATALESGCRALEATSTSVPTITAVLEALRRHGDRWDRRLVVDQEWREGRIRACAEKINRSGFQPHA
jgi:hypothetical protein